MHISVSKNFRRKWTIKKRIIIFSRGELNILYLEKKLTMEENVYE